MNADISVLGIDLGGSSIKWGIVNQKGSIIRHGSSPLPNRDLSTVRNTIRSIKKSLEGKAISGISAVGIGTPGLLNRERTIVRTSPNFPEWRQVPLRDIVQEHFASIPVIMENDANLLCFSETLWGTATGKEHVIVITLGTGVGGGILSHGILITGAQGGAGEIGHMCVVPGGRTCSCGAKGCLEEYCSIRGLMRTAEEEYHPGTAPESPEELFHAASKGDKRAIAVFEKAGDMLGTAFGSLINLFNPEAIVVGGGVAGAGDFILEPARMKAERQCYRDNFEDVTITHTSLGAASGFIGAAALAFHHLEKQGERISFDT